MIYTYLYIAKLARCLHSSHLIQCRHMDIPSNLRKEMTVFLSILAIVLVAIITLYQYDQQTGVVSAFASRLFNWLVD